MQVEDQAAVRALLVDPATWDLPPATPVEIRETHASVVFIAGDRALKLKRAVRYPYLDYSTPGMRATCCRSEVRLNRRTAPDLYLGVRAVLPAPGGGLRLGPRDASASAVRPDAVDWVVEMQRFAEDRQLDALATAGALQGAEGGAVIEALAIAVATFHAAAECTPGSGGARGLARVVAVDHVGLEAAPDLFPPEALRELTAASEARLADLTPLLDARRASGWVRRCHGDLHLANVVLMADGRPVPFDGIEFSEDIACIDVLFDLAFLVMDLMHRGLAEAACRAVSTWVAWIAAAPERTPGVAALAAQIDGLAALPLMLSLRAAIRANVTAAALRATGGTDGARAASAKAYFATATALLADAATARPRLVAIGGRVGTGKSTLAHALAPALRPLPGALLLRSDVLRKRLAGVAPTDRLPEAAYGPEAGAAVFETMAALADRALQAGRSVICDGVYLRPEERAAIAAVARARGVPFTGIWLEAPEPVRIARAGARAAAAIADASDAGPEVAARQSERDPGPLDWVMLDATAGPGDLRDAAAGLLDRPG